MAHPQQLRFAELLSRELAPHLRKLGPVKVLEIGSYDVNGSVRKFFSRCDYVGADLAPGPGVDVVGSGHELDFPDSAFDLALSCECFEHNPHWKDTLLNMHRMVGEGGLVAVTCASRGRLEHGTRRTNPEESPGTQTVGLDYYRNLNREDFEKELRLSELFSFFRFWYMPTSRDLYFIGVKGKRLIPDESLENFDREVRAIRFLKRSEPLSLRLALAPLNPLNHLLDDRRFQNIAVRWVSSLRALARFGKTIRQ